MATSSFAWRYDASLSPDWPSELVSLLRSRAESGVRAVYVLPVVALRLLRLARGWSEGRCAFLVADEGVFEAAEMNVATDPGFLTREGDKELFADLLANAPKAETTTNGGEAAS